MLIGDVEEVVVEAEVGTSLVILGGGGRAVDMFA